MKLLSPAVALLVTASTLHMAEGLASTDSYMDADPAQSGYLPNHNMDPTVVDSSQFGQLWKVAFNPLEKFYAKPLVYTPNGGGNQLLFLASSQNIIRTLDAKSGKIINSRQVHTPFLQSDIGCSDIPNSIGITGTPVIDPATDIAYFFSKTYIPGFRQPGSTGMPNGVYYFHAVSISTLNEVAGFPLLMDGSVADNAPSKYFIGGAILQRPSLTQVGSVVYGAFGGHCDQYNYTGLVLGVDVSRKQLVTQFATESGPLAPGTNGLDQLHGGGRGGIWMSGMGLSTDGNRIFWVAGNGDAHENDGTPASGGSGCLTLGEACVNLNVASDGKLSLTDYFQPFDYQNMDAGDQDLGSGGLALLDPTVFKGTGVSKMAVTVGKNGKIYILNANNLGGYRLGPGQTDGVIQVIATNKAVFGGAGSYPLEGGYIYVTPVGYPTFCYKLGFTDSGAPIFIPAGHTNELSAGRVGTGIPTITTNQGRAGTAILWMADPDAGLRAWYAVPGADGILKNIRLPQVNGLNKFQRPVFGDGRVYVTDSNGALYCLGSPVNLPLNCTSPVSFGNLALGSAGTQIVNCVANIPITSVDGASVGDRRFVVNNASFPKSPLATGGTFSFPVTWNLSAAVVLDAPGASYGSIVPGIKSTALSISTTNGVPGYSTLFPISLMGTEVSQKAFLVVAPTTVDYGGLVILDNQTVPTSSLPFTISNAGVTNLTLLGYAYSTTGGDVNYTNATITNGIADLGPGFTSTNLPPIGSILTSNQAISVASTFNPVSGVGNYHSFLRIWTDGGTTNTILEGSASTAPLANLSISTSEGGWLPVSNVNMAFGQLSPGSSPSLKIRICNNGGSVLIISKSKPPNGLFRLSDPTDLQESQQIPINSCAYGTVIAVINYEPYNSPDTVYSNTWTLNTNDLNFGVHVVQITGTVVAHKVGPLNGTNQPVYTYLGCYQDRPPPSRARLFSQQPYVGANNTNGNCQTLCNAGGYVFGGTEYMQECWCGNTPPSTAYLDSPAVHCSYTCAGDSQDICGGNGGFISVFYDSTRYTPGNTTVVSTTSSGPPTPTATGVPQTQPTAAGNYVYFGCYTDDVNKRALPDVVNPVESGPNTPDTCAAACNGYTFAGVEFSGECFCAMAIGGGNVVAPGGDNPNTNGCSMTCPGNPNVYCGGVNRLNIYKFNNTALTSSISPSQVATGTGTSTTVTQVTTGTVSSTAVTSSPTGPITIGSFGPWAYLGCYNDSVNARALTDLVNPIAGNTVTIQACAAACQGYSFFGTEYSHECFCGNLLKSGSALVAGASPADTKCNMVCAGDPKSYCGGPDRLNMYQQVPSQSTTSASTPSGSTSISISAPTTTASSSAVPTATGPITVTNLSGWQYLGCYNDSVNARVLTDLRFPIPAANVSIEACAAACATYNYFATEYSQECFCGNTIMSGSVKVAGSDVATTGCSMVCAANSTEYCGGRNRLNMYQIAPVAQSSISSTSISNTVSAGTSITSPTLPPTSTPATTTTTTSISSGQVASLPTTNSLTSIASATSATPSTTITSIVTPVATSQSSSAASSTSSSPVATWTPTVGQVVNSWAYLGCANDSLPRALDSASRFDNINMTIESCQTFCSTGNNYFGLAGLEYSGECFCGTMLQHYSSVGFTGCNMPCSGNGSEICGGGGRLSLFNLTTYVPPQVVPSVGNYVSKGCFNEAATGRLLSGPSYTNATGMTVESCVSFCQAASPSQVYAGVEYGQECFCGSSLPATATNTTAASCNMLCSGNRIEFCGAGKLLGLYHFENSGP